MDYGLRTGQLDLASVGPITFGPGDVLLVADNGRAKIVALDVADPGTEGPATPLEIDDLDTKLAAYLGCPADDVAVRDMAVHPRTHNVYLSIMRGRGDDAIPVILRIDHRDASLSDLPLDSLKFAEAPIGDAIAEDDDRKDLNFVEPPEGDEVEFNGRKFRIARPPARSSTVTDLAYVDDAVLVAGLSNEEFSSTLRRIPFPFDGTSRSSGLEIFHVSHGKWETAAPIRTFVPFDGGRSILASYTCTPLVHFSLADLSAGGHVKGRTVAELGAGNQPLDIVSYQHDGREHLLVSHSTYPVMKIDATTIAAQAALTEPREPVGISRETLDLPKTTKLANLDDEHVLALQRDDAGRRHLRSLKTASL